MFGPDLLGRFTSHLKEALQKSLAFTITNGRDLVEPGDLLAGLIQEKGSLAFELLSKAHISFSRVEERFRGSPAPHAVGTPIAPDLSPMVKRLLEKCVLTAHLQEQKYVGTEHLLFAILEAPLLDIHAFLEQEGLNITATKQELQHILKSTSRFPEIGPKDEEGEDPSDEEPLQPPPSPLQAPRRGNGPRPKAMDVFTRDLTHPDAVAKLDPVIGREEETDRVIQILCRRLKNNPILLGEPGVGKTAIVEGLAQRIATGDVPDLLQGKRLLAVDLALLVAGTMYRGEFEARLKQLVEEAKQDKNTILFIDEIHTIVGAGSTSGSLDAANILKPALARGEIRCIGATTWNEYKKHIEPDAALERRYQIVDVVEPSIIKARQMLEGLKKRYEEHHGVFFQEDTLNAAIHFAERYLADRRFPDKAIDLLDEAGAMVASARKVGEPMERLRALDIALSAMQEAKEAALASQSLEEAAKAQEDEERLQKEKQTLEKQIQKMRSDIRIPVTREHIANIIARHTRVPIKTILETEQAELKKLETTLRKSIVGQKEAVREIAETIRQARLGLRDPRRPKASFLFVGPSGVGKTEMARSLAKAIFGKEESLLKFDMSEFAEGHSISKLLGSPAGYVGYREGNRLTDELRKHPHAVILFDEFEKAHPDVQHILLQALEDGTISDATNRPISLRHAYLILTSNVGAELLHRSSLGFGGQSNAYTTLTKEALKDRFRPELLNRLDRVIVFKPLQKDALKEILRRELDAVLTRLQTAQQIAYTVSENILDWLLAKDMQIEEGGRAARRMIEQEITTALAKDLLEHPTKRRGKLEVKKNKLTVR